MLRTFHLIRFRCMCRVFFKPQQSNNIKYYFLASCLHICTKILIKSGHLYCLRVYIKYILHIIYILNCKNVNYVANIQIYLILISLKLCSLIGH